MQRTSREACIVGASAGVGAPVGPEQYGEASRALGVGLDRALGARPPRRSRGPQRERRGSDGRAGVRHHVERPAERVAARVQQGGVARGAAGDAPAGGIDAVGAQPVGMVESASATASTNARHSSSRVVE